MSNNKTILAIEEKPLIARRLAVVPTTNCTLNCRLCGDFLFTGGGVERRDIPFEDVCRDIDACFDLFDHVEWLQFVGGEVYIYSDFAKLIRYVEKYNNRFNKLVIETNATIAPNADEQAAMLAYGEKLFVFISNYGDNSYEREMFIKFLSENNIGYSLKKYHGKDQYYNGWIDNTIPRDLKEPGDVLEVNSKNCPQNRIKNMHVYDGKLHRCSNSCFMLEMGLFLPKERDFVNLRDNLISREEKREILNEFYDYARQSCRYCKQKYMAVLPRFPAAEQM
ncbi:MAG: hypothetical protein LBC82_08795 [Oscillospiraceae bacterium]|jgi:hypothetical protein|nr:hypothetical protein [Oscillospiraceae bacterium]